MRLLISTFIFLLLSSSSWATTYYIKKGGGTSTQCTGTTNVVYDGSGTGEACAYNHLGWLLRRGAVTLACGDTVYIDHLDTDGVSQAKYEVGYNDPAIVKDGTCYSGANYDCTMAAVPNCTASNPIKIYADNYNTEGDDYSPLLKPELWGSGRVYQVLDIGNYTDVRGLFITKHDDCMHSGPGNVVCDQDCTGGVCQGAYFGVVANSNTGWILDNVDIAGFLYNLLMQRAGNFTLKYVKSVGSSSNGIGTDYPDVSDASWTGVNLIDHSKFGWAGCGIHYPLQSADLMSSTGKYGCFDQDQGSYADCIGHDGGGSLGDLTIRDSEISYCTHDGLDFLYNGSGTLKFYRNTSQGVNGNVLKVGGLTSYIENNTLIGNCGFFDGQTFQSTVNTANTPTGFTECRAGGDLLALNLGNGTTHRIYGNTLYTNGGYLMAINSSPSYGSCSVNQVVDFKNNAVYNGRQYLNSASKSAMYVNLGVGNCTSTTLSEDYNQIYNTNAGASDVTGTHSRYGDPLFSGTIQTGPTTWFTATTAVDQFGLSSTSPLRYEVTGANSADETLTYQSSSLVDRNRYSRGSNYDTGAVEYSSIDTSICTPVGEVCNNSSDCCEGICSVFGRCYIPGSYLYNITPIGSIKFQ